MYKPCPICFGLGWVCENHPDRAWDKDLTPLVVADLTRGTGRYNLALGAVATVQGIGASLSGLSAGLIVDHFGYGIAFLTSGAVAGIALVFLLLLMPETALERGLCKAWSFSSAAARPKIF